MHCGCTVEVPVIEVLFLCCIQEVAKLKEEDIITHTAAAPKPITAVSFGGHDPTHTLSESLSPSTTMISTMISQ